MRRLALSALIAAAALGCAGGGSRELRGPDPAPDDAPRLASATATFRRIGRLASGDPLPFVGTMAFAGGPGDTVLAILGLSLDNRSLTFVREPAGYGAHYRVSITLRSGAASPLELTREEVVRVATLAETGRTDESVLFQQTFKLLPGQQHVIVALRDLTSGVESRAEGDYDAPELGPGRTSQPILAYQAKGRGERSDPLQLVLNPRGVLGFSGDTMLAYVEGYGFKGPATIPFEVRDERDSVVWRDSLRFQGARAVESQVLRLAPDSLVLGELRLVVDSGVAARRVSALVSFTSAWPVTSYDQMLNLLRYFGPNAYLDSLRKAPAGDRARLWRRFWRASDPNPKTPRNEQLEEYFSRVAAANAQIKDEGIPGWRTDRGEVFITLGAPDESSESGESQSRIVRWIYQNYGLSLYFIDQAGFGRYRLSPQSRSDYERVLDRLRRASAG
ncbi:MAG TPA: GWxTD domain-containing protein [Gemmatimonadales bacterium]|nr:GWxTD domain-containing protein [Gemmatimonadales bacterium]